ncbi:retropepsin-like aspartic protease family protein [Sphingomonas glaciei]|uniref:TIGR02281 family clan AA aspartic protease n=1 Tax=Sphingomonas glaciei TaxID=2938948 RepID=A0ABY5N263_9SPHN|nr:TIGR02281 family clan AA aspartic protease [Sphingomonas glaciei]UUR08671.1 TIGR02281 family clan AA aspartic protease [Sphingomonas glaciei]
MDDGQLPNALILLVMLVFIATSLVGRGLSAGKAARMGFAWIGIFAVVFALFAFRVEFGAIGARLESEALGDAPAEVSGGAVRIAKRDDGHFWVDGKVNDREARFLVDSGATTTTISADLATAAGLEPGMRGNVVSTANGSVFMPRVTAGLVEIGPIRRVDKSVNINPNDGVNVLGMDFLSSLSSWGVQGNTLVLQP